MLFSTYALIARKWRPVVAVFVVAIAAACWFLMMSAQKKKKKKKTHRRTVNGRNKKQFEAVLCQFDVSVNLCECACVFVRAGSM